MTSFFRKVRTIRDWAGVSWADAFLRSLRATGRPEVSIREVRRALPRRSKWAGPPKPGTLRQWDGAPMEWPDCMAIDPDERDRLVEFVRRRLNLPIVVALRVIWTLNSEELERVRRGEIEAVERALEEAR